MHPKYMRAVTANVTATHVPLKSPRAWTGTIRRRIAHEALHEKASIGFRPLELEATHTFLRNMLAAGEDDLEAEVRLYVG